MKTFNADAKKHGLGGCTKKEQTRDELLAAVQADRAARNDTRQRAKAALVLQSRWRGRAARSASASDVAATWFQRFAPLLPDASLQLTCQEVATELLPPALFTLLSPTSRRSAALLHQGAPLDLAGQVVVTVGQVVPAKQAAAGQVVPAGPAVTAGEAVRPAAPSTVPVGAGGSESGGTPSKTVAAMLRLLLGLLIRTLSSASSTHNYLALALTDDDQARRDWLHQASRVCHLCCAVVAATPTADPLLEAAAVRVLVIMTDGAAWKVATSERSAAASAALLRSVSLLPAPLLAATSRAMLARTLQQQQQQPVVSSAAAPGVTSASASKLLGIVLRMLSGQAGAGSTTGGSGTGGIAGRLAGAAGGTAGGTVGRTGVTVAAGSTFAAAFVRLILLSPYAAQQLPCDVKDQLLSPAMLGALCASLQQVTAARTTTLLELLWAMANMTLLLACGSSSSNNSSGGGKDSAVAAPLADMQIAAAVADPRIATFYVDVVTKLATAARTAPLEAASTAAPAAAVGGTALAFAAGGYEAAARCLWPLGQRAFVMGLLSSLEAGQRLDRFAAFAATLVQALSEVGERLQRAKHTAAAAAVPSVLNTLAFAPPVLPKLWAWLCVALGLPREAPLSATRGLDVAALATGLTGLRPEQGQALGLFCRVYCHLLLVLDDSEFYEGSDPFTLPQVRAIVTSLNSLVYHTYLPKTVRPASSSTTASSASPAASAPAASFPPNALLAEYSPLLLRGLYERDVRRTYCQPQLWLAPYTAMYGAEAGLGAPSTAAATPTVFGSWNVGAVLQSLIFSPAVPEDDTRDGAALQVRPGEGSRPASVAALLRMAPHCVPFTRRVELFRQLLLEDKARGLWDKPVYEGGMQPIKVTIRRDALMEDAFASLSRLGPGLKARLIVTFINSAGLSEAGLDFGGLMKELLEEVVRQGLTAGYGLFLTTEESGLAYPNPAAERMDGGLALLEFLGLMVGKALYEGILLSAALAPIFVTRLQGRRPILDDMRTLDAALHRSLQQVKHCTGDVSELGLDFTVDDHFFGATAQHELLPGGAKMTVTNENRLLYCHLLADWHLNIKLGRPADAFARGLSHLIPITSLRLFNPLEFNELISGGEGGKLDVDDLRAHVKYSGGFGPDSATVKLFWKVVSDMDAAQCSALLRFATSCSRAPLGGFRFLQPPFTLHKVDCDASPLAAIGFGQDVERLPSASTCYNMLKLPNYRRSSTLKTKLLQAIMSGAGFELS